MLENRTTDELAFAEQIRERYPEGLTGIFAVGGTRTTYALEMNRQSKDPGAIKDYSRYADFLLQEYFSLIRLFFSLGGQNMIVPVLSYQSFSDRGAQYAELVSSLCLLLTTEEAQAFYQENGVDPYFVGIDTLLHTAEDQQTHQLGAALAAFHQQWAYQPGRRKIIWEIAPIPLFSIWQAHDVLGAAAMRELEAGLAQAADLQEVHDLLYRYYARALYGTDIPAAHFYLGTNRNGDLKLRAMLPIALTCGSPMRLFYLPYPSLYVSRETLKAILEDLAFGKPLRSNRTDYSGQYTSEIAEAEYQRVQALRSDPDSTIGLIREISQNDLS